MIDPRALQQHFQKVQQRQEPKLVSVPRISDSKPLTAIEPIVIPKPVVEQKEVPVIEPTVLEVPKIIEEPKQEVHLVIDTLLPIKDLVVDEIKEEILELKETKKRVDPKTENPYGYSVPNSKEEDYDPYRYYSGPRF